MARSNTGSTSNWLEVAGAVVTSGTPPFTMACWFNVANVTATHNLIGMTSGGGQYHTMLAEGTAGGDPVQVISQDGSGEAIATTAAFSANVWSHAAGVWSATNSRTAYLNGTVGTTQTSTRTPSLTSPRTTIGAYNDGTTRFGPVNGSIAEAAIWNVALDAAEIASLAAGVSPLLVRPASLRAYWPLVGRYSPELDLRGNFPLTINGTMTAAAHCRVFYPAEQDPTYPVSSSGVTTSQSGLFSGLGSALGVAAVTVAVATRSDGVGSQYGRAGVSLATAATAHTFGSAATAGTMIRSVVGNGQGLGTAGTPGTIRVQEAGLVAGLTTDLGIAAVTEAGATVSAGSGTDQGAGSEVVASSPRVTGETGTSGRGGMTSETSPTASAEGLIQAGVSVTSGAVVCGEGSSTDRASAAQILATAATATGVVAEYAPGVVLIPMSGSSASIAAAQTPGAQYSVAGPVIAGQAEPVGPGATDVTAGPTSSAYGSCYSVAGKLSAAAGRSNGVSALYSSVSVTQTWSGDGCVTSDSVAAAVAAVSESAIGRALGASSNSTPAVVWLGQSGVSAGVVAEVSPGFCELAVTVHSHGLGVLYSPAQVGLAISGAGYSASSSTADGRGGVLSGAAAAIPGTGHPNGSAARSASGIGASHGGSVPAGSASLATAASPVAVGQTSQSSLGVNISAAAPRVASATSSIGNGRESAAAAGTSNSSSVPMTPGAIAINTNGQTIGSSASIATSATVSAGVGVGLVTGFGSGVGRGGLVVAASPTASSGALVITQGVVVILLSPMIFGVGSAGAGYFYVVGVAGVSDGSGELVTQIPAQASSSSALAATQVASAEVVRYLGATVLSGSTTELGQGVVSVVVVDVAAPSIITVLSTDVVSQSVVEVK